MKDIKRVKAGKKALNSGRRFENLVRKDLEENGWIVSRWQNNVEFGEYKKFPEKDMGAKMLNIFIDGMKKPARLIPAKQGKFRKTSTGFPDFIILQFSRQLYNINEELLSKIKFNNIHQYLVIGVECKSNGYLTPEERAKCRWLLENKIFNKILIAKKKKVGRKTEIEYIDFETKHL